MMTNPSGYLVMRLFQTHDRQQVCLDLRTVSGVVQETESLLRVCFGSSEVIIRADFDKFWEQVDKAKRLEVTK